MKPHLKKYWVIGAITAAFIARMESVLRTYERTYNAKNPFVCFDERPCYLIDDIMPQFQWFKARQKKFIMPIKKTGVVIYL